MKPRAILLWILTLVAGGAAYWLASIGGLPLAGLVLDAPPLSGLLDVLMLILLAAVLIVGLAARGGGFLKLAGWGAPLLGAVGCLGDLVGVWNIAQRLHVSRLAIVAPSIGEALLPLVLGLLVGATATLLGGRKAKAQPG